MFEMLANLDILAVYLPLDLRKGTYYFHSDVERFRLGRKVYGDGKDDGEGRGKRGW